MIVGGKFCPPIEASTCGSQSLRVVVAITVLKEGAAVCYKNLDTMYYAITPYTRSRIARTEHSMACNTSTCVWHCLPMHQSLGVRHNKSFSRQWSRYPHFPIGLLQTSLMTKTQTLEGMSLIHLKTNRGLDSCGSFMWACHWKVGSRSWRWQYYMYRGI
jgi:hypothetical protein